MRPPRLPVFTHKSLSLRTQSTSIKETASLVLLKRFSDLRKRMRRTLVVGLAIAAWHLATIAASAQQTLTSSSPPPPPGSQSVSRRPCESRS